MNTDTMSTTSLNSKELQLGTMEQYIPKTPVSDNLPRYHQTISYGGSKLAIQVPANELYALIYSSKSMYGDAVLVPLSNWLKHQFNIIDTFVEGNVRLPNELTLQWSANVAGYYKPIYSGQNIFISMSKYCRFTQDVNGTLIDLPSQPRPNFGRGSYTFTIEVPSVYIGPHKSGHLYTTNLRVTRIHFQSVASDMSSTLVQNYAMPVSQSLPVNPSIRISQSLPQTRQMSPGMDIGPDEVKTMTGVLPTETLKNKRRRKTVVLQ